MTTAQVLEDKLFQTLKTIISTIQNEKREVVAVLDGLSALMGESDRQQYKQDAETCLMMTTQYPMVLDPVHVDDAILRRSCKFLSAQIVGMLQHYNKYAVPFKTTLHFNAQYIGGVSITWTHHVELAAEGSPADV